MEFILYFIYLVLILVPIYFLVLIFRTKQRIKKAEWVNAQEYTILRIDVPRNNEKSPLAAEQMFASIHGIFSESSAFQNHLSFEICAKDKSIQFYIFLPKHLKDFVEGQVYAQYPTVEINEVEDYTQNIVRSRINYATCELALTKPEVYPIRQFTDFEVDPLSAITSVMSKMEHGEEVWFQLLVRPTGDNWQNKGNSLIQAIRNGKTSTGRNVINYLTLGLFNFLKDLINQAIFPNSPLSSAAPESKEVKLSGTVEEALKSIEQKITKLGYQSKLRVMSISGDPTAAKVKCQNIAASFKQFNTTNLNGFVLGETVANNIDAWDKFTKRSFEDDGYIFNIAELASIYHLPHESVTTPNIVWSGSKKGEPPANLPLRENSPVEDFTVIGETNFRNEFREFGIKRDDRRRHIYIVGKSGVGKSVLIENMAVNDMYAGRGVIAVDPHGDLVDKLLSCVPDSRIDDVIVFDPSDRNYPIAFNLLDQVSDDFKGIIASGFVGIFKKIFGESWGPRLEHILRNTVLALLDYPNSTMLDIPRMLTNNRFREKVVEKVKDTVIKDFWVNEFAQYDNKFRTEAVSPILNKVGQFLASDTIRNIVGQPKSSIDIREIMDQEKILLVNLSRGKIGEDNSALLGAMVITKIQLAAMSRADVTIDKRPDTYLYVDEFQNFATESFATILSEARKYNLALTIAHQYIAQLKEEVRDAVIGNAGTILSFRVGGGDTDTLVKELEPVFDAHDLVNLDKYHIYIKLLIDGVSSAAFSARTLPPIQKLTGNLEKVLNLSHERYSNTRANVEAMMQHRIKEEEEELRAEAEAFKKGGLEALLTKKNFESETSNEMIKPSIVASDSVLAQSQSQNAVPPSSLLSAVEPKMGESAIEDHAPREEKPRLLKYQNIIGDKIYKERTARGGIKWYFGESLDEAKFAEAGIIIDEKGKKMIEVMKKVFGVKPITLSSGSNVDHSKKKENSAVDGHAPSPERDDHQNELSAPIARAIELVPENLPAPIPDIMPKVVDNNTSVEPRSTIALEKMPRNPIEPTHINKVEAKDGDALDEVPKAEIREDNSQQADSHKKPTEGKEDKIDLRKLSEGQEIKIDE